MTEALLDELIETPDDTEDGARLLAGLMHRMRNALTSVRGYGELLAEADVSDDRRRTWATRIVQQIDRIEDLQARLDAGRRPRPVPLSLDQVVRAAIERSAQRRTGRAAEIVVDVHTDGDVELVVDGDALTEAVAALIDNACEANALLPDAAPVVIDVRITDDSWTRGVRDRGPGMTFDVAERAGTAFFTRKPGHMGLGLYLSRIYLRRHDMDLDLGRAAGAGIVATIRGRRLPSNQ